jgi:hypothetical protein
MKTQKNKIQGLYLKKKNNRWKWMAGATAATAAGVTAPPASAITIDLLNNYISAFEGNHLNADLTGDGHSDVMLTGANFFLSSTTRIGSGFLKWSAKVNINGVYAQGYDSGGYPFRWEILGSQYVFSRGNNFPPPLEGRIPISFTDPNINGDRLTNGFLEVTVDFERGVHLDSFSYNIPENGSSLALLAIGAGGVLALRRWKAARGRSLA